MILRLACAAVTLHVIALKTAFTLGSAAGAAAVIGVCAARRAMAKRDVPRPLASGTG